MRLASLFDGQFVGNIVNLGYTEQFKKKVTFSHVYNEVTSEPTITRCTTIVFDAGKCFGPPPPGETVLQNGDFTAEGVLYPTGYRTLSAVKVLPSFLISLYFLKWCA
jgi:hypothetical protein